MGGFISEDPIGIAGGANFYAYADGNPISEYDPYGLLGLDDISNAAAGFGDTISFGLTSYIRGQWGVGGVDNCSSAYGFGQLAGVAYDVALGGAGGLAASEANAGRAGYEFSHWIPNRFGGPRSLLNGNYVSQRLHYLTDPKRFPTGWQQYGDKLPAAIQQLLRIPWVYPGEAAGAAVGAASVASQGCGC
jgi:hypothetical protein